MRVNVSRNPTPLLCDTPLMTCVAARLTRLTSVVNRLTLKALQKSFSTSVPLSVSPRCKNNCLLEINLTWPTDYVRLLVTLALLRQKSL